MTTCFPSSNNQRDSATMLYLRAPLPSSYSENMMTYMNFSTSSETNTSRQETLSNYVGSRNVDHEFNMVNPMAGVSSILQGTMNSEGEGLSLTLSTHEPSQMDMSSLQYLSSNPNFSSFLGCNPSISGENRGHNGPFENNDDSQSKQLRYSYNPASVIPSSKYLKLAQELLDQVVNVKQAIMEQHKRDELVRTAKETNGESSNRSSDPSAESTKTFTCELSAAKKQEVQDKTTKLLTMLDEVDRRYRQYYHQMQIVVSAFDTIAGSGAAKPYTALALKTISRQFRFLRDAINGQIRVARKSLGEEDSSDNGVGISRLRYVDQQLRQQRALQQLGMMQSHNWRPQRGLPESSVTILRAWLFEHFLHPYPKDSEKTMLARQTGLTRSQVSNWFINARVRLWKPMVEEMYKKEVDDVNIDTNSSESAQKALNTDELHQTATSTETKHCKTGQPIEQNSNHVHDIEMVGPNTDGASQNLDQGPPSMDDRGLYPDTLIQSNYGDERFISAAYEISELERFESGNGVSLTLGLQGGIQTLGFDFTDSGNRQREFVPSCVLHDFVA